MFGSRNQAGVGSSKKRFYKTKKFKVFAIVLVLVLAVGGYLAWKTGYTLNKISGSKSSSFE